VDLGAVCEVGQVVADFVYAESCLVYMLGCVTERHVGGGATIVWWDEGQWDAKKNEDKLSGQELRLACIVFCCK
jgi:hypothetical protein